MTDCLLGPLQAAAHEEGSHAQQQVLTLEKQCTERVCALEAQLAALEKARVASQTAAEHKVVSEEGNGLGCQVIGQEKDHPL